jgi:hypothetical protein
LHLDDGRLGLIDYGQTRRMEANQRVAFAKVVLALEDSRDRRAHGQHAHRCHFNATCVAGAMREAGFSTRNNTDDNIMLSYARILFDSDEESEEHGFVIPQEYFASLMHKNPLVAVPDSARKLFVGQKHLKSLHGPSSYALFVQSLLREPASCFVEWEAQSVLDKSARRQDGTIPRRVLWSVAVQCRLQ